MVYYTVCYVDCGPQLSQLISGEQLICPLNRLDRRAAVALLDFPAVLEQNLIATCLGLNRKPGGKKASDKQLIFVLYIVWFWTPW